MTIAMIMMSSFAQSHVDFKYAIDSKHILFFRRNMDPVFEDMSAVVGPAS